MDGNGCQKNYDMKYAQETNTDISESNLFSVFISLIKLYTKDTQTFVWQKSAPLSFVYCRPLSLQFKKETASLVRNE